MKKQQTLAHQQSDWWCAASQGEKPEMKQSCLQRGERIEETVWGKRKEDQI